MTSYVIYIDIDYLSAMIFFTGNLGDIYFILYCSCTHITISVKETYYPPGSFNINNGNIESSLSPREYQERN